MILGLGHPRTGTNYTSQLITSWGLDVAHEELGADGIIAWELVKPHGPYPGYFNKQIKRRMSYNILIYNVRNPIDSIPSIIYTEDNNYESVNLRKRLGVYYTSNSYENAIRSILRFDHLIKKMNPDIIYRIEDESEKLFNFLKPKYPNIEYNLINKTNERNHSNIDLDKLKKCPKDLLLRLDDFCKSHGYESII